MDQLMIYYRLQLHPIGSRADEASSASLPAGLLQRSAASL